MVDKKLVEYKLEHDGSILIEVEELELEKGMTLVAKKPGELEKATKKFGEDINKVLPIADTIVDKFRGLNTKPDSMDVEFGIKMNGQIGAFIAASSVEANFKITLSWNKTGGC
ncbi:CU044_2847 family protein [Methanosarcina sp. T3]|uniref:CU044_2847 family protein n=1 Tax=Methanosarcina sp. T3 TaxID=3439062 RepID=UPI003F83829D